jgi:hypothetical protein
MVNSAMNECVKAEGEIIAPTQHNTNKTIKEMAPVMANWITDAFPFMGPSSKNWRILADGEGFEFDPDQGVGS